MEILTKASKDITKELGIISYSNFNRSKNEFIGITKKGYTYAGKYSVVRFSLFYPINSEFNTMTYFSHELCFSSKSDALSVAEYLVKLN